MAPAVPHIFIIEDEEINREIIIDYIDELPDEYAVDIAKDGEDAWAQLQQDPAKFDIILLDRMMPGMNGMQVLEKIKSHPVLTHLPVIFQSALISKEEIEAGIKAGAHYYLTKPFDFELFQSVIRTAVHDRLEYRRLKDELTDQYSAMTCLESAHFQFKSITDAKKLAILLANACKGNPEKSAMGLTELFVNAVEHGNLAITYEEKSELMGTGQLNDEIDRRLLMDEYKSRVVTVEFEKKEDVAHFTITDEGDGFDWVPFLSIVPERVADNHGRGIAMAGMLSFDELNYIGCGNQVKATIKPK